jgi:hypothetical protein
MLPGRMIVMGPLAAAARQLNGEGWLQAGELGLALGWDSWAPG